MDKLQEQLLGLVAQDYESIDSIYGELCESVGYAPNDEEIARSITALVNEGLVSAYIYSEQKKVYEPAESENIPPLREGWYVATSKGKEVNASG